MTSYERADNIIISPEARTELQALPTPFRWYARELIQLLSTLNAAECENTQFNYSNPTRSLSLFVEVVAPFFVISGVLAGLSSDGMNPSSDWG